MSMFAPTQTNRFAAAVAGAGVSNWLSYYGENSIDQWMIPFFGASVYDDPAVYAKSSAINFIKKDKTPTLVLVGQYDGETPAPQSFEFWHALQDHWRTHPAGGLPRRGPRLPQIPSTAATCWSARLSLVPQLPGQRRRQVTQRHRAGPACSTRGSPDTPRSRHDAAMPALPCRPEVRRHLHALPVRRPARLRPLLPARCTAASRRPAPRT